MKSNCLLFGAGGCHGQDRVGQANLKDPSATNAPLLKLNPALNPQQALRDNSFSSDSYSSPISSFQISGCAAT